ncbi:hypothetical protein MCEMIE22_00657 [Mycobacteriaceae bacterium]
MSMSIRSALVPAVAMATIGAAALSPVMATPGQSVLSAVPSIDVRTADIELAGIGQDIYYSITPTVQYVVGGGSYLINFVPLIGGVIAAQININYFQGIQPVVEATVNYLAGVVQDPLNFGPTTAIYASTLYDIAYNWVSAQLQWVGLTPLPPLPPLPSPASARESAPGESAPAPTAPRAAAAAVERTPAALRRTARAAVAPRLAASADADAQEAAEAPRAAAVDTPGEVRTPARATRGQAARAVRAAGADTAR